VNGAVTSSTLMGRSSVSVNAASLSGVIQATAGSVVLGPSNMPVSGQGTAQGTVSGSVGALNASISAGILALNVPGNVAAAAHIEASRVNNLSVTGSFAGVLDAIDLFDSGTLVQGSVLSTARLTFSVVFGNGAITFGTDATTTFKGQLTIGSDLTNDL